MGFCTVFVELLEASFCCGYMKMARTSRIVIICLQTFMSYAVGLSAGVLRQGPVTAVADTSCAL